MTDKFLKAKHWQLFLLTFGLPMIFQFIMMGSMIFKFTSHNSPDPTTMFSYVKIFPLITILFVAVYFGWFWSVAVGLQKKVPVYVKMKVNRFKVLFFIPLVYLLLFMSFFSVSINSVFGPNPQQSVIQISQVFAVILPLHLFSMFCIFHSLYFVAKTFKTVELQREVSFSDFAGEFFMIWFYPIGIWIVQPKINKMLE